MIRKEWRTRCSEAARRSTLLDNMDAEAHTMLARAHHMVAGDTDSAIAEAREAVSINPYNAMANSILGALLGPRCGPIRREYTLVRAGSRAQSAGSPAIYL